MKRIFLLIILVSSCSEATSSNNTLASTKVLETDTNEQETDFQEWKQAFGIDNFNQFYLLRGEFFFHKLDPSYCSTASKHEENLRDLPWGKGLSIKNYQVSFPSFMNLIRVFIADIPIIVAFRNVVELDPRFYAETKRIGYVGLNGDYVIEEVDINVRYTIRIISNDIFKLKMEIDNVNTQFRGFFAGPQPPIDLEGFTTFYRVNGPGMLYKEWPDGTFDPRKAFEEWEMAED